MDEAKRHPVTVPSGYLTLLVQGEVNQIIALTSQTEIGRDKSNTIVISDQKISRHHATLLLDTASTTVTLVDRDSSNGTYVNNLLIKQPTILKNNDTLRLGDTHFIFTLARPSTEGVERVNRAVSAPPPHKTQMDFSTPPPVSSPPFRSSQHLLWILLGCIVLAILILFIVLAFLVGIQFATVGVVGLT